MDLFLACPTCMAPSNDQTTQAVFWAIWSLLFVLLPVLGGFFGFIVYLVRRGRRYGAGVQDSADSSFHARDSHAPNY